MLWNIQMYGFQFLSIYSFTRVILNTTRFIQTIVEVRRFSQVPWVRELQFAFSMDFSILIFVHNTYYILPVPPVFIYINNYIVIIFYFYIEPRRMIPKFAKIRWWAFTTMRVRRARDFALNPEDQIVITIVGETKMLSLYLSKI